METKTFKELDENRQLEIVSNSINSMNDPLEYMVENVTTELEEYGFEDPEIMYSGFHSQGDGASFTCKHVNIEKFLLKEKNNMDFDFEEEINLTGDSDTDLILTEFELLSDRIIEQLVKHCYFYANITRNSHHYYHENTVNVNVEYETCNIVDTKEERDIESYDITDSDNTLAINFTEYLDAYMSEWVKSKCKDIYRRLEKEWEDLHTAEMEYLKGVNEKYAA